MGQGHPESPGTPGLRPGPTLGPPSAVPSRHDLRRRRALPRGGRGTPLSHSPRPRLHLPRGLVLTPDLTNTGSTKAPQRRKATSGCSTHPSPTSGQRLCLSPRRTPSAGRGADVHAPPPLSSRDLSGPRPPLGAARPRRSPSRPGHSRACAQAQAPPGGYAAPPPTYAPDARAVPESPNTCTHARRAVGLERGDGRGRTAPYDTPKPRHTLGLRLPGPARRTQTFFSGTGSHHRGHTPSLRRWMSLLTLDVARVTSVVAA